MLINSGSDNLFKAIINSKEFEQTLIDAASPTYIISGSGIGLFKSQMTNMFVSVPRGVTVCPIDDMTQLFTYCNLGQDILMIPTDEIIDCGWN